MKIIDHVHNRVDICYLTKMPIKNRIVDIEKYLETSPKITGLSEIHIFFEPVNPKKETVETFVRICDNINKQRQNEKGFIKIKACHLSLDFKNVGIVRVMQSSRYITSDNMNNVIKECYEEADQMQNMFDEAYESGEITEKVSVIREKIEAIASANGVPLTTSECKKFDRYFEFHIKLRRKNIDNISPVTDLEEKELIEISKQLSEKFSRPVPLSFVNNQFHQRFLNVRFEEIGLNEIRPRIKSIEDAINATDNFEWDKTISEYVWFDSFRALDKGWIDF